MRNDSAGCQGRHRRRVSNSQENDNVTLDQRFAANFTRTTGALEEIKSALFDARNAECKSIRGQIHHRRRPSPSCDSSPRHLHDLCHPLPSSVSPAAAKGRHALESLESDRDEMEVVWEVIWKGVIEREEPLKFCLAGCSPFEVCIVTGRGSLLS
ncbi:hypothetical protein ARMGADRAFT_568156 [Armillaria gallica]|uniref:Uncharacterized protein n=1 Tax=Armillaria gallica TaxID=47427 RepID=A0A2H3E4N0_ARMGA|nr:hypothetical protein ARMGADRAFT_568156 [Armillaria gallica]